MRRRPNEQRRRAPAGRRPPGPAAPAGSAGDRRRRRRRGRRGRRTRRATRPSSARRRSAIDAPASPDVPGRAVPPRRPPDGVLDRRLPGEQLAQPGTAVTPLGGDLGLHRPQRAELLGDPFDRRRIDHGQRRRPGPLHPPQHVGRRAAGGDGAEPEVAQLGAVAGRQRPQLGRRQRRPVPGEVGQPGPAVLQDDARRRRRRPPTAPPATRPFSRTSNGAPTASSAARSQRLAGDRRSTERLRHPPRREVRLDGLGDQTRPLQRPAGPPHRRQLGRTGRATGQPGVHPDDPRLRGPAGPSLVLQRAGDVEGLVRGRDRGRHRGAPAGPPAPAPRRPSGRRRAPPASRRRGGPRAGPRGSAAGRSAPRRTRSTARRAASRPRPT